MGCKAYFNGKEYDNPQDAIKDIIAEYGEAPLRELYERAKASPSFEGKTVEELGIGTFEDWLGFEAAMGDYKGQLKKMTTKEVAENMNRKVTMEKQDAKDSEYIEAVDTAPAPKSQEPENENINDVLNELDDLMGNEDGVNDDETFDFDYEFGEESNPDDSQDFLMTKKQKQMVDGGLRDFLVIDKKTGPYSAYKQNEVVDSMIFTIGEGMWKKEQSFKEGALEAHNRFRKVKRAAEHIRDNWDTVGDQHKKSLGVESADDADELAEEIDKVLRNWDQFIYHTKTKMSNIFGITDSLANAKQRDKLKEQAQEDGEAPSALDAFSDLESSFEKISFDDGATFQMDHKDTASARFKLFLALQKSASRNFLGMPKFVQFDTVYDEVQMILADHNPNFDEMVESLEEHAANKPYVRNLIARLKKEKGQIKKEFVVAFTKQRNNFIFNDFKIITKDNGAKRAQLRSMASNRNNQINTIEAKWIEAQKRSEMVIEENGELKINPETAKKFEEKRKQLAEKGSAPVDPAVASLTPMEREQMGIPEPESNEVNSTEIKELLDMVGIVMDEEAVAEFMRTSEKRTGKSVNFHLRNKNGIFSYISNVLNGKGKEDIDPDETLALSLNNPLTGSNREGSSIRALASIQSKYEKAIFSNSHRNVENKVIYSYSANHHLSNMMRILKEGEGDNSFTRALAEINFSKNSLWLDQMMNDPTFREEFKIGYVDGLNKQKSKRKGKTRGQQSDRERILQELAAYQNSGHKTANFIYDTVSDKGTTPVITALKNRAIVDGSTRVSLQDGKFNVTLGAEAEQIIRDIVFSEILRIEGYKPPKDKTEQIKSYEQGVPHFFLFPFLNDEKGLIDKQEDGRYRVNNKEEIVQMVIQDIVVEAKEDVKTLIEEDLVNFQENKVLMDQSYLEKIAPGKPPQVQVMMAALDKTFNYAIARSNMMQLVSGDPALHWKKDVQTTLDVVTKRLAKDIAPGLDGSFDDRQYTVVYAADKESDTKLYDHYKEKLGKAVADAYTGMEGTDAQELTTLEEHIKVMWAYGKLEDSFYHGLIKKINDAKDSGKDVHLEKEELEKVLQPMKPVQVYFQPDVERQVGKIAYIKSSSFPLIPQLTKGLEIDSLRKTMERDGVDRLVHVSAAKLGATNIQEIWNGETGGLQPDLDLSEAGQLLDRTGFRIQQEVPYNEKKAKILTGSQMNKLLFEGLLGIPGMSELKARKEAIRVKLMEMATQTFLDKIGVTGKKKKQEIKSLDQELKETGDVVEMFSDLKKLKQALINEASSKSAGYPINDIQALEITPDGKGFVIPLGMNNSSKKFEAMLFSLASSIVKRKMPGKSYVQGSSAGFLTGATTGRSWNELSDKDLGSIMFTGSKNFDFDKGLQFLRQDPETGKTLPAQVLMPFYFKDKNPESETFGKTLDVTQFTKKVGNKTVIDMEKVPEELLRVVGFRIPTQRQSSMLPIEIVGFLPKSMGDLIIVPDEITKQMGSDFDVDKLYTYNYNYKVVDGKLVKVEHETREIEYKKPEREPAGEPSEYVNHSGGASGADSVFDTIGKEFGQTTHKHYYYGSKTPKGNVELTKEQVEEGIAEMRKAAKILGKNPQKESTVNLLARNWFQVKNADEVFAVAPLKDTKDTIVEGGTGWAVAMAWANNKPVNLFDTKTNKWYRLDQSLSAKPIELTEAPTLTKNFAGIGSRDITKEGTQAIRNLYESTFLTDDKLVDNTAMFTASAIVMDALFPIENQVVDDQMNEMTAMNIEMQLESAIEAYENDSQITAGGHVLQRNDLREYIIRLSEIYSNATVVTEVPERYAYGVRDKVNIPVGDVTLKTQGKTITLNEQQTAAYSDMLDWHNNIGASLKTSVTVGGKEYEAEAYTLEGYAGTGKTTIIKKFLETVDPSLEDVAATAPTHKAKIQVRKTTGVKDYTVHKLLGLRPDQSIDNFSMANAKFEKANPPKMGNYKYVVIDEASMLNKDLFELTIKTAAQTGTKLIFMGDPAQLPPVKERFSRVFSESKEKSILSKVERQEGDNPLGRVYDAIRTNVNSSVDMFPHVTSLNEKGQGIEFQRNRAQFEEAAGKAMKADPDNVRVIAYSNKAVSAYNKLMRQYVFPGKYDKFPFLPKEQLMFYNNIFYNRVTGEYEYTNSEDAVVKSIERGEKNGYVGTYVEFQPNPDKQFQGRRVFIMDETTSNKVKYAKELLELTNKKEAAYRVSRKEGNRAYGILQRFKDEHLSTFDTPHPSKVNADGSPFMIGTKDIDYGYALTSHKSQGSTYKEVFVDEVDIDSVPGNPVDLNKSKYVALSRPTEKATVFTNQAEDAPVGKPDPNFVAPPAPFIKWRGGKPDGTGQEVSFERDAQLKERLSAFHAKSGKHLDVQKTVQQEEQIETRTETVETEESLQNEYIDIHWDVLTHPEVFDRVTKPLDRTNEYSILQEAEKITKAKGSSGVRSNSKLYTSTSRRVYKQNKSGKDGVGVFSLMSTFNATMEDKEIILGTLGPKRMWIPFQIQFFEGFSLSHLAGGKYKPDLIKGDKGDVAMDMQNASVDNANEQLLDKIHLNDQTFYAAQAMGLVHDGETGKNLDMRYIARTMSQQIIFDYVKEFNKLTDNLSDFEGSREQAQEEARKVVTERYLRGAVDPTMGQMYSLDVKFTPEMLMDQIENADMESAEWRENQVRILHMFSVFEGIGQELKNAQQAINTDSKGLSPSAFGVKYKSDRLDLMRNSPQIRGLESLLVGEVGKASALNDMAISVFKQFFPQLSPRVQSAIDTIADMTGKENFGVEDQQRIYDNMLSYLFSSIGIEGDVASERDRLLISTKESPSLADRLEAAKNTWGKNNKFLYRLTTDKNPKVGEPDIIEYSADRGERYDEKDSIAEFLSLLSSSNDLERELGEDLVKYGYLTSGRQQANNFMKFIPNIYLMTDANIGNRMRQVNWAKKDNGQFLTQFFQHNPAYATTFPVMNESMMEQFKDTGVINLPAAQGLNIKKDLTADERKLLTATRVIEVTEGESGLAYQPYLKFFDEKAKKNRLFRHFNSAEGIDQFVEIDTAGGDKGYTEYNSSKKGPNEISSQFSDNYSAQKAKNVKKKPGTTEEKEIGYSPRLAFRGVRVPNKVGAQLAVQKLGLQQGMTKDQLFDTVLKNIVENSNDPAHATLAKIILVNKNNTEGFTVQLTNQGPKGPLGTYMSVGKELSFADETAILNAEGRQELRINLDRFVDENGEVDITKMEGVLLHELVHAQTAVLMRAHEVALSEGRPSPLPANMIKQLKSIDVLRQSIISQLSPEDKALLNELESLPTTMSPIEEARRKRKGQSTKTKMSLYAEAAKNKDKKRMETIKFLYGLTSATEFVAQTMSGEDFQRRLNGYRFDKKRSMLDRFLELIANLYVEMANSLGIPVKSDSALKAAMEEVGSLLEMTKTRSDIYKESHVNTVEEFDAAEQADLQAEYDRMMSEDADILSGVETKVQAEPEIANRVKDFIHGKNKTSGIFDSKGNQKMYPATDSGFRTARSKAIYINTKLANTDEFIQEFGPGISVSVKKAMHTGDKGTKSKMGYKLEVMETLEASSSEDFEFGYEEAFEQATIDPRVKKIIDKLSERRNNLLRKMQGVVGDQKALAGYKARAEEIEEQIDKLKEEGTLRTIRDTARVHLDWAEKTMTKKEISPSEIREVENVVKVWLDLPEVFDAERGSGVFGEMIDDVFGRAKNLDRNLVKVRRQEVLRQINKETTKEVQMEDLETMYDTNMAGAYMFDASRIDSPAIQALSKWLQNAARDTNFEFTQISEQISEAFDKLKETEEFKNNKFDIFLQKNSEGENTGRLVTELSQDWYDALRAVKSRREKSGAKGWKEYFAWMKKNTTVVDTRALFEADGSDSEFITAKNHREELEKEYGKEKAEELINQARELYLDYLQKEKAFEDYLDSELALEPEEKREEIRKARLVKWKNENSPISYINSHKGQSVIKGIRQEGYRYVVTVPKKSVNGQATKWYDSNFDKIQSNPELKAFYDFYTGTLETLLGNLPLSITDNLNKGFMPQIQKDLIEKLSDGKLRGVTSGLYENFVDALSDPDSPIVSSDRDMATGKINKRVPIKFIAKLEEGTASNDLVKALEMFSFMSLNYKHKSKVEDRVMLMRRLIDDAHEQHKTSSKVDKRDTSGQAYKTKDKGDLSNIKKSVDHMIDSILYDQKRAAGASTGVALSKDPKKLARVNKIKIELKQLSRKLDREEITQEEYDEQAEKLTKEANELGSRDITTVDIADFLMQVTQLKGMALNPFSAMVNMTFGIMTNFTHAAGGEDFTSKQLLKAYGIMMAATGKSLGLNRVGVAPEMANKIHKLMDRFDVLFEVSDAAYRGNTKRKNLAGKMSPYELQKRAEYFIQGMNLVAKMLNTNVRDANGDVVSLWDAFDADGKWDRAKMGENINWDGNISEDGQMVGHRRFVNATIQLNKRLHGNYDPNSFPLVKKYWIGRMAMQFRSWVGENFANRFEAEQYDEQLGRNVKGYYRSVGQNIFGIITNLHKVVLRQGHDLSNLPDVDKANIKKAFTEAIFLTSVTLVGLVLTSLAGDDDDEEDKKALYLAINMLNRVGSDLTFFANPASTEEILSNFIPAMRTLIDFKKAMNATWKYMTQDDNIDGRKKVTGEKLTRKWAKAFPITNVYPKYEARVEKILGGN